MERVVTRVIDYLAALAALCGSLSPNRFASDTRRVMRQEDLSRTATTRGTPEAATGATTKWRIRMLSAFLW